MATTLFNKTALANGTSNLIVRSHALNQSTDLVQAGVVFNDAVRASTGLFSLSGSGNQNPFLGSYTTDIHAVQNDIAAMLADAGNVTLGGAAFALNTTDTSVLTNVEPTSHALNRGGTDHQCRDDVDCGADAPRRAKREIAGNQRRRPSVGDPQQCHVHGYYRRDRRGVPKRSSGAPMILQHSLRQRQALA